MRFIMRGVSIAVLARCQSKVAGSAPIRNLNVAPSDASESKRRPQNRTVKKDADFIRQKGIGGGKKTLEFQA
jgi:hypothetical protein